jgi:periplasmic protein TonB
MKKAYVTGFENAAHLPVVGEEHPLRIRYRRFVLWGIAVASMFHLMAFGSWFLARTLKPEPPPAERIVKFIKATDLGVPPSISQDATQAVQVAAAIAPPSLGVPVPVADFQATTTTIATQDQLAEALVPTTLSSLDTGGGDSLIVDIQGGSDGDNPSPDDFVAVEEMPVLIQPPVPVYPDMARQAEVEGLVVVRALVGKDGKVQDAIITQGVPMLNDAAIAAVKKAIFKPALQQHKPVAVWVQIPMQFSLN